MEATRSGYYLVEDHACGGSRGIAAYDAETETWTFSGDAAEYGPSEVTVLAYLTDPECSDLTALPALVTAS